MKKHILSYILIVLGGTMTAAAFGLFILPQNFVAGGVTGLSVILQHGIPLPLSWIVFGINILLFVIGWIFAGKEFILKTLIMTFLFPVLLDVFSQIDLFLPLAKDPFLSSLLSGCLLGIGSGIILRANGSSGGFDILGVVLNKKCKIPVSVVMYVCDCTVILLQAVSKPLFTDGLWNHRHSLHQYYGEQGHHLRTFGSSASDLFLRARKDPAGAS